MNFRKGDRVKHPIKDDWGVVEVLEDSNGINVKIFFVGAGEKSIALEYIQPVLVSDEESGHPVLDILKIIKFSTGIKYQSLPQSIQYFLQKFPEGFYGARYVEEEREYKDKAHALSNELLNKENFFDVVKLFNTPQLSNFFHLQ